MAMNLLVRRGGHAALVAALAVPLALAGAAETTAARGKDSRIRIAQPDDPPQIKTLGVMGLRLDFALDPAGLQVEYLTVTATDGEGQLAFPFMHFGTAPDYPHEIFAFPPGSDVTGDGVGDLVMESFSGGAHCCTTVYVVTLEPLRLVDTLKTLHTPPKFENRDDEPDLEVVALDWTFAYWKTGFASSPAPRVVMKLDRFGYKADPELMRAPAWTPAELREAADGVLNEENWERGYPPPSLWAVMLELIYRGHGDMALAFLGMAWPREMPGRDRFQSDFRDHLMRSPHWIAIAELNGWDRNAPF